MAKSIAEWRKTNRQARVEGVELELPSGLVVRVRVISTLVEFLRAGGIPDSLTPLVQDAMNGKTPDADKIGMEKLMEIETAMMDAIVRAAVVYPRVVEDPQNDDEISVDEIDAEDKGVLMELVRMPARKLEPFCEKQARDLESLRKLEALESAPVADVEPAAVVSGGNGAARQRRVDGVSTG